MLMSNSCQIIPKVGKKKKESRLFKSLLSLTESRDITKAIWGATRIPEVQSLLKDKKKDENGEPTINSLDEVIPIAKVAGKKAEVGMDQIRLGAKDEDGNTIYYKSFTEILNKVDLYNSNNNDKVATIDRTPNGYIISVSQKTIENADEPNKLMFRNALNNQLLAILRKLGFDVKVDGSLLYDGIFDPVHSEVTAEGLRTVIRIAKGEVGENAFPEEFSHLIIAGLMEQPLVRRLVESLQDDQVLQQVLGQDYYSYTEKYNNDTGLLAQEAAAKLLQEYIVNPKKDTGSSLLERLYNWVKKLFGKLNESDVDQAIRRANEGFARLASKIADESVIPMLDKQAILDSRPLYKLGNSISTMEELAQEALTVASKRLAIIRARSKDHQYDNDDLESIKNLQNLIEGKKYAKSCLSFLTDSLAQIEGLQKELNKLLSKDLRSDSDLGKIKRISYVLRNIKEFMDGYEPIIRQMMSLDSFQESGDVDLSEEDAKEISDKASQIFRHINSINSRYKQLRFSAVMNFLSLYWGKDKIIEIGKNKGQEVTLEKLLEMADKDINGIERWISSMGDASDALLSLLYKSVKVRKASRDAALEDITAELRAVYQKLASSGIHDTEFMFERDADGKLTGRIISDYDFIRYDKERNEYIESLKQQEYKPYQIKAKIEAWERRHLVPIILDPETGRKELVPIYKTDRLSRLNDAQREYYDNMIKAKSILESLIPEGRSHLYNAVYISSNMVSAIAESKDLKQATRQVLNNIKDNFIRREDDAEFEEKGSVLLDFTGKPVDRLPVNYTTPLENMDRLSLDFTSSIMAYAGMAINYSEMNKIVDVLELARDLIKEREVQQYSGDKKLVETFKIVHQKFSKSYTKEGNKTNIGERLDDYYDVAIYNKIKKDQGTIGSTNIDTAKTLDFLKEITSTIGLGVNLFSGISNITQGKMQMFIEALGGEFFNYKNLAVGKKNYYMMLGSYMGELGSTKKTNKLALLIDKFDALEEFYQSLREQGKYKGPMARILGSANLLFLNNMGEHYLHSRTMLAMLDNYKVIYNGKKISLFDAFEVEDIKDENGKVLSAKLKIKDGVTKEDGSEITDDDLIKLKLKMSKVNQLLNGAFNEDDKGAIHRGALGRLAMQFRQWMPAHYSRRFAGAHYDAAMDQWREGYYRTLGRFSLNLIKDLSRARFELATHWEELNPHEKANMKRAMTEIAMFYILSVLISMMGPEKDKKGVWLDRMIIYNLKRMKVETGASVPISPDLLDNAWTILQSPAASIKTVNNITDLIQFQNMFVEIQSGRYKGWSRYEKDVMELLPIYGQIRKAMDITDEDYMFNIYR